MKSFKTIISEVAQPKPDEEKKFKDQHKVEVIPHPHAGDEVFKGTKAEKPKAKRKADQEGDANYDMAYESVEQIDEISRDTTRSYIRKASADNAERKKEVMKPFPMKQMGKNIEMHKKFKKREAGIEMAGKKAYGIGGKAKVNATESVEQLDELSPNTLHSYIKKAAGNMAGNAAVAAAQASSSMKKSSPDVKRKIKNRMQGITGASGRLADKANMAESAWEEIPMMQRQLDFIAYAADEISDYLDMAGDPEEWFQNKLAGIHQSMLSMYAYAQGGKVGGNGFDEEVDLEEELKGGQKKLDHNKNGKIDAHDFHLMRKKKMKEEAEQLDEIGDTPAGKKKLKNLIVNRTQKAVDAGASLERRPEKAAQYDKAQKRHMKTIGRAAERLAKEEVEQIDEVSQKTLWNYHAKAGADLQKKREKLDKGTLTMKDLKKGQNRVKGLNRAADKMHEEVEALDEAFKRGIVKLKDGSSVTLNKEDAGLLNQMFKDLSANNRKKMQEVAMKDKAGFEEILGFAREAL